jgi:cytochrome c peroxidase
MQKRATCVLLAMALSGCEPAAAVEIRIMSTTATNTFEPLPRVLKLHAGAVALGEKLFNDPIVSGDGKIRCSDCHDLTGHGGAEGRPFSKVEARERGVINTGTAFNLAFNSVLSWDGEFATMDAELDALIEAEQIMNTTWSAVAERLGGIEEYRRQFEAAYPDGVTQRNTRHALAEYQRSLFTPDSRFDRFLRGDETLTSLELEGYGLFKDLGCMSCHHGVNLGGNMFNKLGVVEAYFVGDETVTHPLVDKRKVTAADDGRFGWKRPRDIEDRFVFRVPSLRNVACTAPYLHDGSACELETVVAVMGAFQLGRELDNKKEIAPIVAFLETLTGEYEGQLLCDGDREQVCSDGEPPP